MLLPALVRRCASLWVVATASSCGGSGSTPPAAPQVYEGSRCECSLGTQIFVVTGSDQSFIVPPGCTRLNVAAAGAKGGDSGTSGRQGGAGGLTAGVLAVTPGETLTIIVGQAGITGSAAATYGGGGGAGVMSAGINGCVGGSGGGRSAVRRGALELMTAGGGGGAGDCFGMGDGGAGGGTEGGAGSGPSPGQGGTQSAGGAAGGGGQAGSAFTGGAALDDGGAGGGGGGGWRGGGGGAGAGQDSGGGGGSGYVDGLVSGTTTTAGAGTSVAGVSIEGGCLGGGCPATSCKGTDGECYGPCETGSICTSIPAGNCSEASAGGVYCCAPEPSGGKSGTSTTTTPTCAGTMMCGQGPDTCTGPGYTDGCSFALCDCLDTNGLCAQRWYVASPGEGGAPAYYPCAGCDCQGVEDPMFCDCGCGCGGGAPDGGSSTCPSNSDLESFCPGGTACIPNECACPSAFNDFGIDDTGMICFIAGQRRVCGCM